MKSASGVGAVPLVRLALPGPECSSVLYMLCSRPPTLQSPALLPPSGPLSSSAAPALLSQARAGLHTLSHNHARAGMTQYKGRAARRAARSFSTRRRRLGDGQAHHGSYSSSSLPPSLLLLAERPSSRSEPAPAAAPAPAPPRVRRVAAVLRACVRRRQCRARLALERRGEGRRGVRGWRDARPRTRRGNLRARARAHGPGRARPCRGGWSALARPASSRPLHQHGPLSRVERQGGTP